MMKGGLANVGDVLADKYRVEQILGIGGMGMVVLATHLELESQVAIKFMLPAALESADAAARFLREARATSRLTNDHVCRVTDVGRFEGGQPYIVMEYMEGYDVGTLLKRKGAQPVAVAVDYILQACEGMAEAHGHGIVHRDLKPDNLFLATRADGDQIIKILDFGISKAAVTGIATKTGDIMGSPAYMAPEQMQSTKDVDQRADIWSLGVILYQLISGRMPFIADTLPALCLAVINEEPPSLESIRKDLPHGLAQVVMKCLSKNRNERYLNVHQFGQALLPYAKPEATAAVTRIRGMLQRKRPPTPPPLMMLPSEFSDVAPTITGDDESMPVPKLPSVAEALPAATRTTMGGASGESMSLLNRTRRPGVIGALLGAIALVGLIIVMVLIKRGNESEAVGSTTPTAAPPAKVETKIEAPEPPPLEPTKTDILVEPIPEKIGAPADDTVHGLGSGSGSGAKKRRKDPKDPKAGSGSAVPAVGAGSGSAVAPPDGDNDEDKWGHMQHDGDKKDTPKE